MKLYGFPPSPNTAKILAVAAEIGTALDVVLVDISKGQARTPDFLKLNRFARTPVLVDGDFVLSESTAILTYVASQRPNALMPADARSRALVLQWQAWSLAHWSPPGTTLVSERLLKAMFNMGAPDEAVIAAATRRFETEAAGLDAHLAGRPWLLGDTPTIADFEVGAALMYARPAGIPVDRYPNIVAWYGRLCARPSWAGVLPKFD